MIEICEKSCSLISVIACSTGSFASIAHSSPDRLDRDQVARPSCPLFSRNPFSRIQSSLNILPR